MNTFLQKHGWTIEENLRQDVSPRKYFRVSKATQKAILMQTAPDTRDKPEMQRFVDVANWLRRIDLIAPEIYEVDTAQGLMLLEDLGDTPLTGAPDQKQSYGDAAQILSHITAQGCPLDLPKYEDSLIHARHRWVLDYYAAQQREFGDIEQTAKEYLGIWDTIEKSLPPCPKAFVHADYHAANLQFLPKGQGMQSLGILDFQDALHGPTPYDLCNLLEDARVSVPPAIKAEILKHYDDDFMAWYRVLSLQFHSRVIGLFIMMATDRGKPDYLRHIPRLEVYIRENLENPLFAPLKSFFDDQGISFTGLDLSHLQAA